MSFLSGLLGDKADNIVDQAVDTAARVAKEKVKEMISGGGKDQDESGGMGQASSSQSDRDKKKGGGGLLEGLGGLISSDKPSGGASKDSGDMTDALDELAQDFAGDATTNKAKDEVLSFGKSLFG